MTTKTQREIDPKLTNPETAAIIAALKESPRRKMRGGWDEWIMKIRTSPSRWPLHRLEAELLGRIPKDLGMSFGLARHLVEATRHRIDCQFIARAMLFESGRWEQPELEFQTERKTQS